MIAKSKLLFLGLLSVFMLNSCLKDLLPIEEEPTEETPTEDYSSEPQVFAPRYSMGAGVYSSDLSIELYTKQDGFTIYYTIDGSEPTTESLEYIEPIDIIGDGTTEKIRAIAVSESGELSDETSSFYRVKYEHNNEDFNSELSFSAVENAIMGNWIGYVTTPWIEQYNVDFYFSTDGNYAAHALTPSSHFGSNSEHWYPALYYGTDEDSEIKEYNIFNMNSDGSAKADITILFHVGTTNVDELRHIKFYNPENDYVEFELWHHGQYGPVEFKLTRVGG